MHELALIFGKLQRRLAGLPGLFMLARGAAERRQPPHPVIPKALPTASLQLTD